MRRRIKRPALRWDESPDGAVLESAAPAPRPQFPRLAQAEYAADPTPADAPEPAAPAPREGRARRLTRRLRRR